MTRTFTNQCVESIITVAVAGSQIEEICFMMLYAKTSHEIIYIKKLFV